jgi:hypothetical protein
MVLMAHPVTDLLHREGGNVAAVFHMLETVSGIGQICDESGTLASVRYRMMLEGDIPPSGTTDSTWTIRSGEFVVLSGRIPQTASSRTFTLVPENGEELAVAILSEDHVSGRYQVAAPRLLDSAG